jgi:hypothetical protein
VAQVVSTSYVDDLDGSQASGEVDFTLDGKSYEIDLNDSNAARLRDALAPFVAAARRAGGSSRRRSSPVRSASGRSREEAQEIRSTLRELGYSVKDRGRISADLMNAYETRTPASARVDENDTASEGSKPKRSRKKEAPDGENTGGRVVEFKSA